MSRLSTEAEDLLSALNAAEHARVLAIEVSTREARQELADHALVDQELHITHEGQAQALTLAQGMLDDWSRRAAA